MGLQIFYAFAHTGWDDLDDLYRCSQKVNYRLVLR
jgi:hypothetical protein